MDTRSLPPNYPHVGDLVGGRYRIVRLVGRGGMGAVYEAQHEITRSSVALKYCGDFKKEKLRKRAMAEAKATGRIRHLNVVRIYDILEEDNRLFLVLELLDGETLQERMSRGPMPLEELVTVLVPVLRALEATHDAGIVHRDLKPGNIFLSTKSGTSEVVPKILDFGIARIADGTRITAQGTVFGSPYYMSPEQLRDSSTVDHLADIYSIGAILFHALTGKPPYEVSTVAELMEAHARLPTRPSKLVPELPSHIDAVALRALARMPSVRFQSAKELGAALAVMVPGLQFEEPKEEWAMRAEFSDEVGPEDPDALGATDDDETIADAEAGNFADPLADTRPEKG
ncbi:MAG: serine/threonine protein kinase [Myxococcales bacterium]|nr:serine/threonine protein kinase [Myxococcales bacterium]